MEGPHPRSRGFPHPLPAPYSPLISEEPHYHETLLDFSEAGTEALFNLRETALHPVSHLLDLQLQSIDRLPDGLLAG